MADAGLFSARPRKHGQKRSNPFLERDVGFSQKGKGNEDLGEQD